MIKDTVVVIVNRSLKNIATCDLDLTNKSRKWVVHKMV